MDNLSLPFLFKSVIPSFIRKRDVTHCFAPISRLSFPALSEYGISNFIPRFVGLTEYQKSFPDLSDYGRKKRLSPVCRITEVHSNSAFSKNSHLPVCRITRRHPISFSSIIPRLSDDEMSKMSSRVCLVQRCHQSKCLFLQSVSLQIHFKISQCLFKILFSFHLSSYNYPHGSRRSFSLLKLQYP